MRATLILATLSLAAGIPAARAGEALSPETVLAAADAGKSGFYPGGRDAYYPGAAFGKDTYLIVWQVGRMQEGDILACRVDKSGKVLDEKPFVVSAARDDQERPKVAFGGGVFLVVWNDLRNEKDYDVCAARVTPEGKVLDAGGILVSGGAHNQVRARVAFDGQSFVVVWQDFRANNGAYQIYCARVSPAGRVLDPAGIAITKRHVNTEPAVASPGGGRSLVMFVENGWRFREKDGYDGVFVQGGKVTAERVPPHLRHTRSETAPGIYTAYRSLAAGKNGYLLAYRNYVPAGRAGLDVKANCEIIRPDGKRELIQTLTGKPHRAIDPEVIWDGSAYVAAWTDPTNNQGGGDIDASKGVFSRVYASRLDENGKVLTTPGQPISVAGVFESPAQRVALATDGAGVTLIAYEKHPKKADAPIKTGFRMLEAKQ